MGSQSRPQVDCWTPYFEGKPVYTMANTTVLRGKVTVLEGKFHRTPREGIPYPKGRITVLQGKEGGIKLLIIN